MAGRSIACGYDRKGEGVRELDFIHYRLTKRAEKRLRLEEAEARSGACSHACYHRGREEMFDDWLKLTGVERPAAPTQVRGTRCTCVDARSHLLLRIRF